MKRERKRSFGVLVLLLVLIGVSVLDILAGNSYHLEHLTGSQCNCNICWDKTKRIDYCEEDGDSCSEMFCVVELRYWAECPVVTSGGESCPTTTEGGYWQWEREYMLGYATNCDSDEQQVTTSNPCGRPTLSFECVGDAYSCDGTVLDTEWGDPDLGYDPRTECDL